MDKGIGKKCFDDEADGNDRVARLLFACGKVLPTVLER